MPTSSISSPFPIFTDIDGQPLENGYIFIGVANLGPIGNPINVYWDAALTIPAAQPIRTLGGYPVNNGTPARLYVNSQYSIQVQNRNGSVIYSAPVDTEFMSSENVSYLPSGTGAVATTVQTKLRESVSVLDFYANGVSGVPVDPTGAVDSTLGIQAAFNSGHSVDVPDGNYLITEAFTVTASDIEINCKGFLVFDWAQIGAADAITFSGNNVKTKLNAKALSSAYVLANKATLQAYNCFLFTGNDCQSNDGVSQNNPGFVKSGGASTRFTACGNEGYSIVTGLAQDSMDIYLIHVNDGEGCNISNNKGYGFGHGILFGGSTNESVLDGNNFWDCGNHCIYISSGNRNIVSNNRAEGTYTDIKVRGDYNVITGNNVVGGVLSATNAVVDSEGGNCINSLLVSANSVLCNRGLVSPIEVAYKSGFDGYAENIVVTGNTVRIGAAANFGIAVNFSKLANVIVSCNAVQLAAGGSVADAIYVSPTLGTVITDAYRLTIANNNISGATGQAFQITGTKVSITGNNAVASGGSGTNSGTCLVYGDEVTVTGNTLETLNNVGVINLRGGTTLSGLVVGNILKRVSGGTTTHVVSTYTPVDANNIKIN